MNDATQPALPFEIIRPESSLDQPLATVTAASAPRRCLSTGIPALDDALGGGFTAGRVADVFGPRGAGHLDLELKVLLATQASGLYGAAALIDGARTFDMVEAASEGLNVSRVCVSQPDNLEQAFEIIESIARSGAIDLILVNGLPPAAAPAPAPAPAGDEVLDREMSAQARFFSERLGVLAHVCSRSGATLIFVRELAEDVTDPSGPAVSFHASQRVNLHRREGLVFARVTKDRDGRAGVEVQLSEA